MSAYASSRPTWVETGEPGPRMDNSDEILSVNILHELLWAVIAKVEDISSLDTRLRLPDKYVFTPLDSSSSSSTQLLGKTNGKTNSNSNGNSNSNSNSTVLMHEFVWDIVNDVIDSVETSKLAEAAYVLVSKQLYGSIQGNFWVSFKSLSMRLFSHHYMRCCFTSLCAITQLASQTINTNNDGIASPRDLGMKILALDYMYQLCSGAGEKLRLSKVFGFQVRRLVVPCILHNVAYAMTDHRVFTKLLRIITVLWKVWRQHVLIEFALLVEQFIIPILQASNIKVRPEFQLTVLIEVVSWLDQPFNLVEMFVNFDMDNLVPQW